jgi:hypothetical protein
MKLRLLLAAALALAAPLVASAATPPMHPQLGAKLLGNLEVPKGAPGGHGIVNVAVKANGQVCWTFTVTGIDKATAAHIHKGRAGVAGPIVVPFGGTYKPKGCTTPSKATLAAIEASPNDYYVNVHTAKYPNGAVRGQLVVGMVHM